MSYGRGIYGSTIYAFDPGSGGSPDTPEDPRPLAPPLLPIQQYVFLYPIALFGPISIVQRSLPVGRLFICTFVCLNKQGRPVNAPNFAFYDNTENYLMNMERVTEMVGNANVAVLKLNVTFYRPRKVIIQTLEILHYNVLLRLGSR